jgi:2-polyprenyl-3-methyl-5-hydroxy-6-metoxy-1,4-benzoquinol methylase
MDKLRPEVIDRFLQLQNTKVADRWTGEDILNYELSVLGNLVLPGSKILDLGSGSGELSRNLCRESDWLTAVDLGTHYAQCFLKNNHNFIFSNVLDYKTEEKFDIVLLFGVVTYLMPIEENDVYSKISSFLAPQGIAIIKNQCSDAESFIINEYSQKLEIDYSARYPSIAEQHQYLSLYFSKIQILKYPANLKRHNNSTHVMFIVER